MKFCNGSEAILSGIQPFDPEVKHFYQKNTWKKMQMQIQLVKMI